ncbi:hypothetical protein J4466_03725 [Candidatus Pacearchaeota archaeon]|nr:hypothetical protein [Candidatus Pacearchaeota archaeon]
MKIPVRVEFFAGGLRPIVTVYIKSEIPKIFGVVSAIIDTGSPTTILGGGDIQRMRISEIQLGKLVGEYKELNIGGAQIKTRILPEAELMISGKKFKILDIQIPVKLIKGTPPPTILGIDFLLQGKLSFFFDPNRKEAYLELEG